MWCDIFLLELREDNCPPPAYIVEGVKALISALRTWLKREVRIDQCSHGHICTPSPSLSSIQTVVVTQLSSELQ